VDTSQPVTGLTLKVERVSRRVKANRLAQSMGVSPSRVNAIEREQFPTPEVVARYVAALDTCAASPTKDAA
jgi:hypothetical protein